MEKKRSTGITILAWIFIISGIVLSLPLLLMQHNVVLPQFVVTVASTLAMTSNAFIGLLFPATKAGVILSVLICSTIGIVLGIGILKLANIARIVTIFSICIRIFEDIFISIANVYATDYAKLFYCVITLLIHIFYIIYLTRPKVKEQFK